jgi:electron transport complex protein RnfG
MPARELIRIAVNLAVTCALGAALLGAVYVGTDRYRAAADERSERRDVIELLELDGSASVVEIRQFLVPAARVVVYEARRVGGAEAADGGGPGAARRLVFALDGTPSPPAAEPTDRERRSWKPLGRTFVARRGGAPAGFVVEGVARGYKNRIRFLVALRPDFEIAGIRVVEHEEDPGLGAEIAKPPFENQFRGRDPAAPHALDVTRDPVPEDWRSALAALERMPAAEWQDRHGTVQDRERARPIYAVTGATISSRALADGVLATVLHFRRRWELIAPHLGEGRS